MGQENEMCLSTEQIAKYLGVSTITIRKWIREKRRIPFVRIGRQYRFKISAVDEWIDSGKSSIY